ncbi:hypothetical protein [Streptococcus pneumoniae]|uniref:hypothetical protein n=1 Tax=Streptococcus pneumoniae TaxID=1313 RepID=UPI0021D41F2A|nr:hypothetical protein [Streptococcus pneumoniae]
MSGWETLCESQQNTGYTIDGCYAEYARASARYVVKVPKGVDPFDAAPLTCAGVTTYKAVKVSGARPSDLVAIFGIGGLGHLALQYAKIAGATVVAVDLFDESWNWHENWGRIIQLTPVRRILLKLLPNWAVRMQLSLLLFLRRHSNKRTRRCVGADGWCWSGYPQKALSAYQSSRQSSGGSMLLDRSLGTRIDLAETFELHALGRTRVIYEKRPLEMVNECFEAVEQGKAKARIVFQV